TGSCGVDHRDEPGRSRRGRGVRRDPSAPGRAGGARSGSRRRLGGSRRRDRATDAPRDAGRRPSGDRRTGRITVARPDADAARRTGGFVMVTREIVLAAIVKVAPDVDPSTLATDVDFREEADLDSMDFI